MRTNRLVAAALAINQIPQLKGYDLVRPEVAYGSEKSRIDFLLQTTAGNLPDCYVEVKNVTLDMGNGLAMFPDSVTARGTKHLRELIEMANLGYRAVLFFCVQLDVADRIEVAADIDPLYAKTMELAITKGVEVIAWRTMIDSNGISLHQPIDCL